MVTSKSTLTVARLALRAARDALPDYARRKSPRKFTQPQLLACLIVKEFLRLDYRGMHVRLAEWSDLREVLGSALRGRGYHSQTREIRLRILTHDLMILLPPPMFYTEQERPLFPRFMAVSKRYGSVRDN